MTNCKSGRVCFGGVRVRQQRATLDGHLVVSARNPIEFNWECENSEFFSTLEEYETKKTTKNNHARRRSSHYVYEENEKESYIISEMGHTDESILIIMHDFNADVGHSSWPSTVTTLSDIDEYLLISSVTLRPARTSKARPRNDHSLTQPKLTLLTKRSFPRSLSRTFTK